MKEKAPCRHYLDWAATAIPDEYNHFQSGDEEENDIESPLFGNPSSPHAEGRAAREALEDARCRCALVLGVKAENLYFTSGGTESNAIALHSLLVKPGKNRLLYSSVEHPSVRENCVVLQRMGIPTVEIGVEKDGRVSKACMARALKKHPDARFAAVMGVNNETGSLMDIKALVALSREHQKHTKLPLHFHCDLVQALGKVPVDLSSWDLDSASFSAHKLGGPRGIGLLYLKKPIETLCSGGEQESKIRPGTENTLGALALARALGLRAKPEAVLAENEKAGERLNYLIGNLKKIKRCALIPEGREADDGRFSPWILQTRFRGIPGAVMVRVLDDAGFALSTGSACSSSSPERPVLAAMGVDEAGRLEGIRISQGYTTEISDFDAFLSAVEKILTYL